MLQKGCSQPSYNLSHRDMTQHKRAGRRVLVVIFLGTDPWLKTASCLGQQPPHSHPVFVQSFSLPLLALFSPLLWPLLLSPLLLPCCGPMGDGRP